MSRVALRSLILSAAYNLVSFAAGVTKLPFRQYLAVTVLGGIFHTGFLVALGASATLDQRTLLVAYAGLAALALSALTLRRRVWRVLQGSRSANRASEANLPDEAARRTPEAKRREAQE